jgi:Fe-S-cluster formation regulator IscX/YfhJ
MSTLKNKLGDEVTVDIGGFGGDNVKGSVTDKSGAPINNARVKVIDINNDQEGVEITGNDGEYDIDVDASPGDRVFVHVEWQDATGKWHVVTGFVTLPKEENSDSQQMPEEIYDKISKFENNAMRFNEISSAYNTAMVSLYDEIQLEFAKYFVSLQKLDDPKKQKERLDEAILSEMAKLKDKFYMARKKDGVPGSNEHWAITEELFNLILKLIGKAFILQGMQPPTLPEG